MIISRQQSQTITTCVLAIWLTVASPINLFADETDPSLAAVPEPGINSTLQALVIKFKYDPSTPAEFIEAILSQVPPHQRISAAPQLQVIAFDRYGDMLDIFFTDYVHWVYTNDVNEQESLLEEYGGTGEFAMPFDARVHRLIIRDYPLRKTVLEIDMEAVFQQFCTKQLIDETIVCDFELAESIFSSGFE